MERACSARPRITTQLGAHHGSGLHKRGDYQLRQGAAGCPPDAMLDRTSSLSPGPPGTDLRKVLSKLGISSCRQLRPCLAYLERRMPLRTSPER
jgi:hypothetical protein